jgi:hypothetical protein
MMVRTLFVARRAREAVSEVFVMNLSASDVNFFDRIQ